jgi:Mg-chelatase subunit ChlI
VSSAVKECNIQQVALPASHPSASAPTEICNTVDCDSHSASIPINIQQFIAECREGAALDNKLSEDSQNKTAPKNLDISCQSSFTQSDATRSWAEASEISDDDISEATDFDISANTCDTPFISTPVGRIQVALFKRKRDQFPKAGSDVSDSGSSDLAHEGKKPKSQGAIQSVGKHSSENVI